MIEIENVENLFITDNKVICKNIGKILTIYENGKIDSLTFSIEGEITGAIVALSESIYITERLNKTYKVLKFSAHVKDSSLSEGCLVKKINDSVVVSKLVEENVFKVFMFNINDTLKWSKDESEFSCKYFTKTHIYCNNRGGENKIYKYDFESGSRIWEITNTIQYNTINDNQRFITAIGGWILISSELFVPLRNGKILVIDDDNGEVIKVLFSTNANGQWGEYYHDTSRNKLVKFINKTIHEVDLDTHEIEFFEPSRFKDKDAEPNGGKWAQDETYIYYCSSDGTTVNALNKKTKEIDWQHQHKQNADDLDIMNEVPVRYHSVQYHQGRLFVMDNKRSLHIFEEEDMPKKGKIV